MVLSTGNNNGYVLFYTLNGYAESVLMAKEELKPNEWTHLAATLQNGFGKIYYNGKEVASGYLNKLRTKIKRTTNYIGKSNWSGNPKGILKILSIDQNNKTDYGIKLFTLWF